MPTTGEWTIALPPGFEHVDNTDSWQAFSGNRVVYVSSIAVGGTDSEVTPADAVHATVARSLAQSTGERHSHAAGTLLGEAEVTREGEQWRLKGYMCAAGTVATCVVDYADEPDAPWAIATWRSLEHP